MAIYFQDIIFKLQEFWSKNSCTILQPIDMEVGAATLARFTALETLVRKKWNICQVQSCRRPTDARYGRTPNRLSSYYQMQVILQPAPADCQQLYLNSLAAIGIKQEEHDIRFVQDDWANPSIGAAGLGWEVWIDGMEVTQWTYMQQIGGTQIKVIPVEITYGLERIAMYVQKKKSIFDIQWSEDCTYGNIFQKSETEMSGYYLEFADTEMLARQFLDFEKQIGILLENKLSIPAYECCLKASHTLNVLDSRGYFSQAQRAEYILRIRELVVKCCQNFLTEAEK